MARAAQRSAALHLPPAPGSGSMACAVARVAMIGRGFQRGGAASAVMGGPEHGGDLPLRNGRAVVVLRIEHGDDRHGPDAVETRPLALSSDCCTARQSASVA